METCGHTHRQYTTVSTLMEIHQGANQTTTLIEIKNSTQKNTHITLGRFDQ